MKLGRTWLKVERAIQHLEHLERQIALIETAPFVVVERRDQDNNDRIWLLEESDRSRHLLGVSMYGVIVGDVVHQLRSALDHAVWKLAKPPIPFVTGFPVCEVKSNAKGCFDSIAKKRLQNLDQPAFDYIESVQPYNRLGANDPLWQLNELWNVDKHRTIIVLANPTWNQPVAIAFPDDRAAYAGEVKEPTFPEIVRLDAKSHAVVILGEPGKVRIVFGNDVPAVAGKLVVPTLQWLLMYVQGSILPGLESYL